MERPNYSGYGLLRLGSGLLDDSRGVASALERIQDGRDAINKQQRQTARAGTAGAVAGAAGALTQRYGPELLERVGLMKPDALAAEGRAAMEARGGVGAGTKRAAPESDLPPARPLTPEGDLRTGKAVGAKEPGGKPPKLTPENYRAWRDYEDRRASTARNMGAILALIAGGLV